MMFNCLIEVYKDDHLMLQVKDFYSQINSKDPILLDELIEKLLYEYNGDKIKLYKLLNVI
jgi:hypothetical protein